MGKVDEGFAWNIPDVYYEDIWHFPPNEPTSRSIRPAFAALAPGNSTPTGVYTMFSFTSALRCALLATAAVCAAGCSQPVADTAFKQPAPPVPLTTASITLPPDAGAWSGWRGGDLQGVQPDANPPLKWSREQGVLWRTKLAGKGNSSPVVWGSRIFITSAIAVEGDKKEDALLAVQCYDRDGGQQRWQQIVGRATGRTHLKNGHASSTVVCDADRVIAYFRGHGLTAFDHRGDKLWHRPLVQKAPQWGAASSPLLAGDLVVQLCDGQEDSYLVGVNKHNGEIVWQTSRAGEGSWTSPILIRAATGDQGEIRQELIVNGSDAAGGSRGWITAYDPANGKRLWRARGVSDIACPTAIPVTEDGVAKHVISSSGANGPVFAVKTGGRGDVTRSHVAWRNPKGGPYVPTGLVYDGYLYTIGDNGKLACLDVTDGSLQWSRKLRDKFSASLVAASGRIYAVSESGDTFVFKASPRKFQLLAANHLHANCLATPAIAGDHLLLRTGSHLYCLGRSTAGITTVAHPGEASPSDLRENRAGPTMSLATPGGKGGKLPAPVTESAPETRREPPSALNATP